MDYEVAVNGKTLKLTSLEREYWPGITKGALLAYWQAVAPLALPYLVRRPLSLLRRPHGKEPFWQKNLPESAPKWLASFSDDNVRYLVAEDEAVLLWAANYGAIELHLWGATFEAPLYPDLIFLDLDPVPPHGFPAAKEAAFWARNLAQELGLTLYPKTSGKAGIHLLLPVKREYPYPLVTKFMERFCQVLAAAEPQLFTMERLVKNRKGKVYLDYLQNGPAKTIVAPYSPRISNTATVSTPLTWKELERAEPEDYTILSLPERITTGDPWGGMPPEQQLEEALAGLNLPGPQPQPRSEKRDSIAETPRSPVP